MGGPGSGRKKGLSKNTRIAKKQMLRSVEGAKTMGVANTRPKISHASARATSKISRRLAKGK